MSFIFLLSSLFVFILGLCIGSFLNCVIYRLENKKNFLKGRSFCPKCKHQLSWVDLFPIFSFLFLKGKCRYCKIKISIQYPLVEVLTAVLFLVIFWQFRLTNFLDIIFLFFIASSLIVIFVYDFKYYLIPDKVLFPAIGITFFYRLFFAFDFILNYILAAFLASGFFFLIFAISKGKWMGFGDVKLAILMGFLLGFPNVLTALFLAFLLGAFVGINLMIFGKKKLKSEIPFGPFLITGTFLALFYGENLIRWYISFFMLK
jgi:prepilin signal peptidase PulO-like enzyme (type II secretory pathway)